MSESIRGKIFGPNLMFEIIVLLPELGQARLESGVDLLERADLLAPTLRDPIHLAPVDLRKNKNESNELKGQASKWSQVRVLASRLS